MWWNNVETKPFGGYPQSWDVKTLHLLEEAAPGRQQWDVSQQHAHQRPYGVYEGLTIFEAATSGMRARGQEAVGYMPTDEEWRAPNIYEDTATGYQGTAGEYHPEGARLPVHRPWFFYLARICNHCTYPACLAACPGKLLIGQCKGCCRHWGTTGSSLSQCGHRRTSPWTLRRPRGIRRSPSW